VRAKFRNGAADIYEVVLTRCRESPCWWPWTRSWSWWPASPTN